jgi:glycosyltransferase involved in cell wall biosynthesis
MTAISGTSLRVLHVVATNQRRGGELLAADLVGALAEAGVDQRVAVLRRADRAELRFGAPAALLRSGGSRIPGLRVDATTLRALAGYVRVEPVDVIEAHGSESFKYAALAGLAAPLVYVRIGRAWVRGGARVLAHGLLMRRAARVVALAEDLRRETVETFRYPPGRAVTIPMAVDPRNLKPVRGRKATRRELRISPRAPVILSLAALTWEKDPLGQLAVVARVLEEIPGAVYLLAGEGPMRAELEGAVRLRGLEGSVRLLGSRTDVGDLLAASDVLLLGSRSEGMPRVLIEAGMVGVPAAAYRVSGVPEVVAHGETGLLAAPGDVDGLAGAVVSLLTDDAFRERAGRAARERYLAQFDVRDLAGKHRAVFEELAG